MALGKRTRWYFVTLLLTPGAIPNLPANIPTPYSVHAPGLSRTWARVQDDMGFAPGAVMRFDINNTQPAEHTYLVIFSSSQMPIGFQQIIPNLDDVGPYEPCFWRMPFYDRLDVTMFINASGDDQYDIFIQNMDGHEMDIYLSFGFENPGGRHLLVQNYSVANVFQWFGPIFMISGVAYAILLVTVWRRKTTKIHTLMASVFFLEAFYLFAQASFLSALDAGRNDWWRSWAAQLLDIIQRIAELMMFLMLSLGWKISRNNLNTCEMRFASVVSGTMFCLGLLHELWPYSGYLLCRDILKAFCDLVVIVAMNFNLQLLSAQIMNAPASLDAGKHYRKQKAYRDLRWIFFALIGAPTVEAFIEEKVAPWDAWWVSRALKLLIKWAIYVSLVVVFSPAMEPLRVFELTVQRDEEEVDAREMVLVVE